MNGTETNKTTARQGAGAATARAASPRRARFKQDPSKSSKTRRGSKFVPTLANG